MRNSHTRKLIATSLASTLACTAALVAQDGLPAPEPPAPAGLSAPPAYRPWSVGFEVGTEGIVGGFGSWHFSDHFGVRAGVDYGEISESNTEIAGIHYDARARLLSEYLLLDYYPWSKRSFHVGLGLMFNQNELSGTANDSGGTIIIDGKPFPSPLVGTVTMKVQQQPVNPYLTIGGNFFYFDRAHRWAFGGELGVAYTGAVDASLTRSGAPIPAIDDAMDKARERLKHYAEDFQWWPVAKLSVSFAF